MGVEINHSNIELNPYLMVGVTRFLQNFAANEGLTQRQLTFHGGEYASYYALRWREHYTHKDTPRHIRLVKGHPQGTFSSDDHVVSKVTRGLVIALSGKIEESRLEVLGTPLEQGFFIGHDELAMTGVKSLYENMPYIRELSSRIPFLDQDDINDKGTHRAWHVVPPVDFLTRLYEEGALDVTGQIISPAAQEVRRLNINLVAKDFMPSDEDDFLMVD